MGRAAIGVLRLSGPLAREIADKLAPGRESAPRRAALRTLVDTRGLPVDQVLVTTFHAPASYTGEDVVEISCHGSPPVLRFAVERSIALGARLARPGEFTQRAFRSGRMDLTQAEAVRDLIDATTLYQARVAASQARGSLSKELRAIKVPLVEVIALLEAGIDFAEDDVEVASAKELSERLRPIRATVGRLVAGYSVGKVVRSGLQLAIVGRPNVGKSSLFNRLLGNSRAIVSSIAGTTRDVVSEDTCLDGIPVRMVDTAGIRASDSTIESEGVERSWQSLTEADCALVVVDLSRPGAAEDRTLQERARASCPVVLVGNKADLPLRYAGPELQVSVSAKTGEGMDALGQCIRNETLAGLDGLREGSFVTGIRQGSLLQEAHDALTKADQAVQDEVPHEMLLLDLYDALHPLDAITGGTTLDDVLERIFASFCIGK